MVCYAGIFNDVIGVADVETRLGMSARRDEFNAALDALHREGRVFLKDGFVGLPHLADKIGAKIAKTELARNLVESRMKDLRKLGRNPFIRFVGVSGSVAANNPTADKNGIVDVDVFLITRNQCIWLYEIPKRVRHNFPLKDEPEPRLCRNYVMDESDLRVENRNFYTATEIRNLIPIVGADSFRDFLRANSWVDYYYPGFSGSSEAPPPRSWNVINKFLYVLVVLMYCMKYSSVSHLRKLSFKPDPDWGVHFNRVSTRRGGYQALVQRKFARFASTWFADLIGADLLEKLFPDALSATLKKQNLEQLQIHTGLDYSKYGYP